jgi:hypothetical protein
LRRSADGWNAEPRAGVRLRIDGREVTGTVTLRTGDRIGIGDAPELRLIAESVAHDDGA